MPRDANKFLFDMKNSAEFLAVYVADRTLDDYIKNRGFRSAVERELQIIGEALMQLNKLAPQIASQISEYQRIISFRHILVHGYDSIDSELVWFIVTQRLPLLRREIQALLANGKPEDHRKP